MRNSGDAHTTPNGGFSWGRRLNTYIDQIKAAKDAYEKQIELVGTVLISKLTSKVEGTCLKITSKWSDGVKKSTVDSEKVTQNYQFLWYFNLCRPLLHFGSKVPVKGIEYQKFFGDGSSLTLKVFKQHISNNEFQSLKKQNQGVRPVFTEAAGNREIHLVYFIPSENEALIKMGRTQVNAN